MREKIRLLPSKQTIWLGCIASCLLVGLCGIAVHNGHKFGWFVIILFGLGVFAPLLLLRSGASWMELDEEGFTLCLSRKPDRYLWSHVAELAVWQGGGAFKLAQENRGNRSGQAAARGISGYDGSIPNMFGLAPHALLGLMTEFQQNQRPHRPPQ